MFPVENAFLPEAKRSRRRESTFSLRLSCFYGICAQLPEAFKRRKRKTPDSSRLSGVYFFGEVFS